MHILVLLVTSLFELSKSLARQATYGAGLQSQLYHLNIERHALICSATGSNIAVRGLAE